MVVAEVLVEPVGALLGRPQRQQRGAWRSRCRAGRRRRSRTRRPPSRSRWGSTSRRSCPRSGRSRSRPPWRSRRSGTGWTPVCLLITTGANDCIRSPSICGPGCPAAGLPAAPAPPRGRARAAYPAADPSPSVENRRCPRPADEETGGLAPHACGQMQQDPRPERPADRCAPTRRTPLAHDPSSRPGRNAAAHSMKMIRSMNSRAADGRPSSWRSDERNGPHRSDLGL